MLELIVYPREDGNPIINNSPFCSKSEIFLKMNNLEHRVTQFKDNPSQFPKGKLPVLKDKNILVSDSYFIQKYLTKKYNLEIDAHLTDRQMAEGFAFTKMLEDFFYWSVLHERWFVDKNWIKLKSMYFSNIPRFVRGPITSMIRKNLKKSATGHGMSRHTNEEIHELGAESIKSLAHFIESKKFLLGEKISSYDSVSYAFVSSILHSELGPSLKLEAEKYRVLKDYDQRMYQLIFKP